MGIKVGMPMLKLKRGAASGKHAGSLRAIAMEAGEERASKTKNLDPTRSDLNLHLGPYSKGWDATQAIEEEVADYETEYKKTSYLGRGLRSDAAVAIALIVKPDGEWINSQTPEKQERFFSDSYDVLCELGVVKDKDVRMRERHHDEGAPHEHIISMAYDKDGKLAGSRVVNLKTFAKLNRDYPKKMQEKGWPVDELKAYDPEAVKDMTDDEKRAYKEEHIQNKQTKRHGLSANEYAAMKEAEKANALRHALESENERLHEEVEDKYDHLEGLQDYMEREKERLNAEVNEMIGDLEDVQERVADAENELAELEPKRKKAKKDIEDADRKKHDVFEVTYALRNAMGTPNIYDDGQIIANAKRWVDDLIAREDEIARQKAENDRRARLIADRAKQVDELMKDAQEVDSAPSGFAEFVIDKVKERYPKFYANCEKTWQALQKKRDSVKNRARDISLRFGDLLEADEHKYDDESQYY